MLTNELLLEVTLLTMAALLLSTSLKALDKSMVESVASSLTVKSESGFATTGESSEFVKKQIYFVYR